MTTFASIVSRLVSVLSYFVPLLIGAAVVVFLYGLFGYMMNSGDESKRKESIKYIIYGLIGLFVMSSMWALATVFADFFDLGFGIPVIVI